VVVELLACAQRTPKRNNKNTTERIMGARDRWSGEGKDKMKQEQERN
jgi:hypothetical protein